MIEKYKITHIETDNEIIIKFTIWEQTFSLYPIIKDKDEFNNKTSINLYKKSLKNALDNI